MPPPVRHHADLQAQRTKLANSYNELLDEFSSKDLRSVGNYHLGRLIGKGSFGKVYLASHRLTNGSKVVLKSADKNDSNLAREIHHHRQFLHPHIARLYEVLVTETLVWLVLEYCPGDELYNKLLETGPMEPSKVQRIFTQLVGAVSYVHSKSCVHRDLKLENILLDKNGNVKLVDFGFTREYEGKASYLQTWCGTVCYSAPEMLKGEKYAGEKVDVWSLGIILYALLCGELPFDDDDENTTKMRILKEEPKYPESMPQQAKDLTTALLSKRPLLRPSLSDILTNPWLADHAPQQQAILKLKQPPPFSTELEKETLQRMRGAGVDIDMVIENVLSQRCDSLAGWWALLIEKEERKAKRRERKRKEREAEAKSLRRLSGASGRLERMAPTIKEAPDEGGEASHSGQTRGRNMKRLSGTSAIPDLPRLPEIQTSPTLSTPPPRPVDKDSIRSVSSSRHRPAPPPKENRLSRNSMLHVVQNNPDLLGPNGFTPKRRRRYQQPILNQLASLKHWFKENAKRARSPHHKASSKASPAKTVHRRHTPDGIRRSSTVNTHRNSTVIARSSLHRTTPTPSNRPRVSTGGSTGSGRIAPPRPSLSPSPLTPHSSYRRSSAGLRGRKSTSSSVSSIRSIHHHHTHSKASSTSSTSMASPALTNTKTSRSPHTSVKVLPATPTGSVFPSGVRVVRGTGASGIASSLSSHFNASSERTKAPPNIALGPSAFPKSSLADQANHVTAESSAAFSTLPPPSPGLIFARRKRSPFKGPMLNMGSSSSSPSRHRGGGSGSEGVSRNSSMKGRKSGEIIMEIAEEDEEEDDGAVFGGDGAGDEEVEEVDYFNPPGPGEEVVEVGSPPGSRDGMNVGKEKGVEALDMVVEK